MNARAGPRYGAPRAVDIRVIAVGYMVDVEMRHCGGTYKNVYYLHAFIAPSNAKSKFPTTTTHKYLHRRLRPLPLGATCCQFDNVEFRLERARASTPNHDRIPNSLTVEEARLSDEHVEGESYSE